MQEKMDLSRGRNDVVMRKKVEASVIPDCITSRPAQPTHLGDEWHESVTAPCTHVGLFQGWDELVVVVAGIYAPIGSNCGLPPAEAGPVCQSRTR
jgi:hypothetical protein